MFYVLQKMSLLPSFSPSGIYLGILLHINRPPWANILSSSVLKKTFLYKGAFNNYVDKIRGGGGQKMSVFVHAQGIKTVHAGRGSRNGKNQST